MTDPRKSIDMQSLRTRKSIQRNGFESYDVNILCHAKITITIIMTTTQATREMARKKGLIVMKCVLLCGSMEFYSSVFTMNIAMKCSMICDIHRNLQQQQIETKAKRKNSMCRHGIIIIIIVMIIIFMQFKEMLHSQFHSCLFLFSHLFRAGLSL